jgi:hypothetical protein
MYYVTQRHGGTQPYEIQALWCTLAALKDNVRHMLSFLVDMGMEAGQQVRALLHNCAGAGLLMMSDDLMIKLQLSG